MAFTSLVETTTVAGRITAIDEDTRSFTLQCRSGDTVQIFLGPTSYYEVLTNIDGVSRDRTFEINGSDDPILRGMRRYLSVGAMVFVRGNHLEYDGRERFDGRIVYLLQSQPGARYVFEETHWWIDQIARLADRWLDQLFRGDRDYTSEDFARAYRTNLGSLGGVMDDNVQECATLSRLIYGLSSAYLLTGIERYYLAAKSAVEYQRQAFRSLSHDGRHCFWAFGRRSGVEGERVMFASEFPDDVGTIPLYEQIYALAGLAQYYRITADWEVLEDIRLTLNTFFDFYRDDEEAKHKGFPGLGGYFSHLDYVTLRPDTPSLGHNQSRKNWNSVGDHIPAYLVNLVLAMDPVPQGTGRRQFEQLQERVLTILEETASLIVEKFPDPHNPYVNERFHADWTPDHEYQWQRNRAIIGHNLKIAWNLTRVSFYLRRREQRLRHKGAHEQADRCRDLADRCIQMATQLGDRMAERAVDPFRGGVFDAVEREPMNGMPIEFSWGPTKDFWQQEQGILAYLILYGATGEERYKELARECAAFWNLFFLDRDHQGVFFRTTEGGLPIVQGIYGQKGGHSISGYHAFELGYLAHLYTRSYIEQNEADRTFCLHFKILGGREQETVNVLPDFMPPGRVEITRVCANGVDRPDLIPESMDDFRIEVEEVEPSPRDGSVNLRVEFTVH